MIITNYKCRAGAGKSSAKLQQEISRRLRMPTAKVSVVDVPGHFARAVACNHLHAKARRDSVLLVIDVDSRGPRAISKAASARPRAASWASGEQMPPDHGKVM